MPRKERERRYISEYLLFAFPECDYVANVELGAIPQEYIDRHGLGKAAAYFRPTRPRVDAVRWTPTEYILIEAKLRDMKAGIGDLLYYREMVPETPDLPFYEGQEIKYRLVIPFALDWVMKTATQAGIEVVVFWVDWVADYVHERQNYFTAEYRAKRNETMRLREILGVD